MLNGVTIALEGQPAPIVGRNWLSLASPEVDLSDGGDWVFSGSLDGDAASNLVIVSNGAVVAQEGSGHPDVPPGSAFTTFGTGPIHVSDHGELLYWTRWNSAPTTSDEGLYAGGELIVDLLPPWPFVLGGAPWNGAGVDYALPLPQSQSQAGKPLFLQAVAIEPSAAGMILSNGVHVVLQPS